MFCDGNRKHYKIFSHGSVTVQTCFSTNLQLKIFVYLTTMYDNAQLLLMLLFLQRIMIMKVQLIKFLFLKMKKIIHSIFKLTLML